MMNKLIQQMYNQVQALYLRKRSINGGIFSGKNDRSYINKKIDLNKGSYEVLKKI